MSISVEYVACDATHAYFQQLIAALDEDLSSRYGLAQAVFQVHNVIKQADVIVALSEGNPVGCGCFRPFDAQTVEIKRMYVKPECRGRGIAREVLARLERYAAEKGYQTAILETGLGQPEAIGLYEKCGYVRIPNYGPYADISDSICFQKRLR